MRDRMFLVWLVAGCIGLALVTHLFDAAVQEHGRNGIQFIKPEAWK